jgi:hypothetical protein
MSELPRVVVAKIAFAVAGIGLIGAGMRWDLPAVRLAGIACLAVAFVLRFANRRADEPPAGD